MILRRRVCFVGILVCAILFSLSIPLLIGIGNIPERAFGQNVMTLSQVSSADPIDETIASGLRGVSGVSVCSPEIYSFCVIGDEPVFVRGVELSDYLDIEDARLSQSSMNESWRFVILGEGLSRRLNADMGDKVVVTGSVAPVVMELNITGIYHCQNGTNDLLVPLWVARSLSGLATGQVHAMRIRASNTTAVAAYLESTGNPVIISQAGGQVTTPINTNASVSSEQHLALRYLDSPSFKASNGSYVSLFVQEGAENVNVVIAGFVILEGGLTFIGTSAVLARGFADKRRDIGVLSAIGASRARITWIAVTEVAPVAALACGIGVAAGTGLALLVNGAGLVVMFGQAVQPAFSAGLMAGMFAATLGISVASGAASAFTHASARPDKTMRESGEEVAHGKGLELGELLEVGD
jgi:ABC-type lipoprotein release transport system permease subunit